MPRLLLLAMLAACSRCEEARPSPSEDPQASATETRTAESPEPEAHETEDVAAHAPTHPSLEAVVSARAAIREGRQKAAAGDLEGALAAFDRALEQTPSAARVRCEAGFLAHRAGDDTRAQRQIDIALASMPQDRVAEDWKVPLAMCLYNRGLVAEALDDLDGAVEAWERSLELRPHPGVTARLETALARTGPRTGTESLDDVRRALGGVDCDDECEGYYVNLAIPSDDEECWEVRTGVDLDQGDAAVRIVDVYSTECLFDTVTDFVALRGSEGWAAYELGSSSTANTDSFYREESDDSSHVEIRRQTDDLVVIDATYVYASHYGGDGEDENGEACYVDNWTRQVIHDAIICRLDRPQPECGQLRLGSAEGTSSSSDCGDGGDGDGDSPPGLWSDDPTEIDARRLRFEDGVAVVEETNRPADFETASPGRYSIERLFAEALKARRPVSLD